MSAGALLLGGADTMAFTQKAGKGGVFSPIGHEFLVLRAAKDSGVGVFKDGDAAALAKRYEDVLKALESKKVLAAMGWKLKGIAGAIQHFIYGRKTSSRYEEILKYSLDAAEKLVKGVRSLRAFSVAMGQRWVDEMGFAQVGVVRAKSCFNSVAQEPEDIMADHFMLRGDQEGETSKTAHASAIERFKKYYRAAIRAPDTLMAFRDGALVKGAFYVLHRPYVLLGRAVHLLQDSFSPDHTIRGNGKTVVLDPPYYNERSTVKDYMQIAAIKDWDCSPGTYQHSHPVAGPGLTPGNNNISGDIVWKRLAERDSTFGARVADLKPLGRAAYVATKELFAIFAARRAEGNTAGYSAAKDEALSRFIERWLSLNPEIPVPQVSKSSKTHRPSCRKLPGGSTSVKERLAKDAERNARRQKCLERSGRLASDKDHPDHNKPPYFWRGRGDD